MNKADLQNLTRRFWHGDAEKSELLEIVDIEEIVAASGFTKKSIYTFVNRNDDFPSPVARKGRRLFWRKEDIERWIRIKQQGAGQP